MIFVTVGNATQGFRRLLEAADALAGSGRLGEEPVFLQTGHTAAFRPRHCEAVPFLDPSAFQERMQEARLIVCHGGCGTILSAIRLGKRPVVMPRRKAHGEHVNDHQLQLVQRLAREDRIVPAYDPEDLPAALIEAARLPAQLELPFPSPLPDLVAGTIAELTGA